MLNTAQLRLLIIKILDSELSESDLNTYIRFCASLSVAYLFSRKKAGKLSAEYTHSGEVETQQLALDCIAELFARNADNHLYKLRKYYTPLRDQIVADSDEALFMTRRLIVAHTKQSLARVFQLNDPSGARIYRNLSLIPKRNPEIKLVKHGDEDYFFLCDRVGTPSFPADLNPDNPEIGWEYALHILENTAKDLDTLPQIVGSFLTDLQQESDYRHFICRDKLYKLLRYIMGMNTISLEYEYPGSSYNVRGFSETTESDQVRYLEKVKDLFRSEINDRFVQKSKILPSEAVVYTDILDKYFKDLLMDGWAGKLPDYKVDSQFREMTPVVWKIHRGRLEYIIKLSREQLQNRYRHEFLNEASMTIEDK